MSFFCLKKKKDIFKSVGNQTVVGRTMEVNGAHQLVQQKTLIQVWNNSC